MTLQEKFKQWLDTDPRLQIREVQLEVIAEDFAIELLSFIEGTYSYSNIFDYWYLHADTSKTFTKKELLETYKKEKGL